jgi:protein-L-isoaspartate(D-aspartate) O-methyltransferase
LLTVACSVLAACHDSSHGQKRSPDRFSELRLEMVATQFSRRDITDPTVLRVMGEVPRHLFVPDRWREFAYADHPLPIGEEQTISQPYIVAYMTQALQLKPGDRVLEIGTGSGYQAAVLAELVEEVYTIEIVSVLAARSKALIEELGYANVRVRDGDGYRGWPEAAPFSAVIVTAAPDHVPKPLVEQLAMGGRMVLPLGDEFQKLVRLTKSAGGVRADTLLPVRFVPMTGKAQAR